MLRLMFSIHASVNYSFNFIFLGAFFFQSEMKELSFVAFLKFL